MERCHHHARYTPPTHKSVKGASVGLPEDLQVGGVAAAQMGALKDHFHTKDKSGPPKTPRRSQSWAQQQFQTDTHLP